MLFLITFIMICSSVNSALGIPSPVIYGTFSTFSKPYSTTTALATTTSVSCPFILDITPSNSPSHQDQSRRSYLASNGTITSKQREAAVLHLKSGKLSTGSKSTQDDRFYYAEPGFRIAEFVPQFLQFIPRGSFIDGFQVTGNGTLLWEIPGEFVPSQKFGVNFVSDDIGGVLAVRGPSTVPEGTAGVRLMAIYLD